MAAFKNKDNGTWYVQFRYTDWKGERQQKLKRGFATKREALEWEREFLMEKQADVNMTFESFVALYERDIKPKLKLNTWLTKESIIKKKILPYFAKRKLSEITAKDIMRWQNEIREMRDCHGKPLSKTYLKTVHNQLSAIFNHAARFYGLNLNPARQAGNMGAEERKEMLFWTREEYTKFSEAMMDKPLSFYAFEVLYWCGIREGELLALTPADFDFEKRTLTINKSYQRLNKQDVITTPKTPKSNRVIQMPQFLCDELQDYLKQLYGVEPDSRMFPISKSYLHREMDRGCKQTGVKRIRIHDLRHMARGDGIHRTNARNMRLTAAKISNAQQHNEREKESYVNQDIVPERTHLNVHFKKPTAGYAEMFEQLKKDGIISTRGLKEDAVLYGELVFDVNTAYFHNHGGYDFAKQFYTDAYKSAIESVGGEQYILSAVMHADERNRAMSDALGQDVYHYHLHVVYIPIVEKQILWSKRCKDKSLVGTVKETIQQVSMSKKWDSKPALDEHGKPLLNANGKTVLRKSYSVLQDDFFAAMRKAGYDDVERGERGSSEEHLTVTQFKVQQEQARLAEFTEQNRQQEKQAATLGSKIEKIQNQRVDVRSIEKIVATSIPFSSKVAVEREDFDRLSTLAKKYVTAEKKESKLQKALDAASKLIAKLKAEIDSLKQEISDYKSVHSKLRAAELERENTELRGKVRSYEDVIQRNNLWRFFHPRKEKAVTRDEAR